MIEWPNEAEKQALRRSFLRFIPASERASEALYAQLFRDHPGVRPLFPAEMDAQKDKLIAMLGYLVDQLDDPEGFRASCAALGRAHVGYGAAPAHYPVVGSLLIEQFGAALEPPMTPAEAALWRRMYDLVAEAMLAGATSADV